MADMDGLHITNNIQWRHDEYQGTVIHPQIRKIEEGAGQPEPENGKIEYCPDNRRRKKQPCRRCAMPFPIILTGIAKDKGAINQDGKAYKALPEIRVADQFI